MKFSNIIIFKINIITIKNKINIIIIIIIIKNIIICIKIIIIIIIIKFEKNIIINIEKKHKFDLKDKIKNYYY